MDVPSNYRNISFSFSRHSGMPWAPCLEMAMRQLKVCPMPRDDSFPRRHFPFETLILENPDVYKGQKRWFQSQTTHSTKHSIPNKHRTEQRSIPVLSCCRILRRQQWISQHLLRQLKLLNPATPTTILLALLSHLDEQIVKFNVT